MPLYKSRFLPLFSDPAIPNNITCDEPEYCHQFIPGDHLRSQFYQTPCGQNEICDPLFADVTIGGDLLDWAGDFAACPPPVAWTLGSGWACNAGTVAIDGTTASGSVTKTTVGLLPDTTYKITFDVTRTAGYFRIQLDDIYLYSNIFDVTGSYTTYITTNSVIAFDIFVIDGDGFTGSVSNVKIEPITYACWTPDPAWTMADDMACKTDNTISGNLTESVANYTTVDGYYQLSFTVSNYVSGTLVAKVAGVTDQDTTIISANGNYTLYFEPTASGVVSFEPSTDFIGCISSPDLRELKNDFLIQIVEPSSETALYTIGATYYHEYVTFDYDIDGETFAQDGVGLPFGCYNLYIYDSCTALGNNLITNPNFVAFDDWNIQAGGMTFNAVGGQLSVTFNPYTGSDLISNGTFGSGTAGWTFPASWAVVGGKAQHTAGSTSSISQNITVNIDTGPGDNTGLYVRFEISGRTAGNVRVKFEGINSAWYGVNDTICLVMSGFTYPTVGTFAFEIEGDASFDGSIDNIEVYEKYLASNSSVSYMINAVNPLMVAANYKAEIDLISVPNSDVYGVNTGIYPTSGTWSSTPGLVTNTFNGYTPGSNQALYSFFFNSRTWTGRVYPGTIVVENPNLFRIAPFEATYISECIQYREELPKSKLFVGYCDTTSLGFDFTNTGFKIIQRLVCRSFAPTYEVDRKIYNYGSGRSGIYYSEVQKWFGVYLDPVPETVHDSMAFQLNCDHFEIGETEDNTTEYIGKPDDYTPEWERSGLHSLATVRFDVKPKEGGQFFNRDC